MEKFFILGHRGYRAKYPENTAISFIKAFEYGADGVECDIQKTLDGEYVIIHDDTVDRTSNGSGSVSEMTLEELKRFDFSMKKTDAPQRILTLKEFLQLVPTGKLINLELKEETLTPHDCEIIYDIAKNNYRIEDILFSSFEPRLLEYFVNTNARVGFLFGYTFVRRGPFKIIAQVIRHRPEFLNMPVRIIHVMGTFLSGIFVRFLGFFGWSILIWTVNSPAELEFSLRYSRHIITDDPVKIKNMIKEKYGLDAS